MPITETGPTFYQSPDTGGGSEISNLYRQFEQCAAKEKPEFADIARALTLYPRIIAAEIPDQYATSGARDFFTSISGLMENQQSADIAPTAALAGAIESLHLTIREPALTDDTHIHFWIRGIRHLVENHNHLSVAYRSRQDQELEKFLDPNAHSVFMAAVRASAHLTVSPELSGVLPPDLVEELQSFGESTHNRNRENFTRSLCSFIRFAGDPLQGELVGLFDRLEPEKQHLLTPDVAYNLLQLHAKQDQKTRMFIDNAPPDIIEYLGLNRTKQMQNFLDQASILSPPEEAIRRWGTDCVPAFLTLISLAKGYYNRIKVERDTSYLIGQVSISEEALEDIRNAMLVYLELAEILIIDRPLFEQESYSEGMQFLHQRIAEAADTSDENIRLSSELLQAALDLNKAIYIDGAFTDDELLPLQEKLHDALRKNFPPLFPEP